MIPKGEFCDAQRGLAGGKQQTLRAYPCSPSSHPGQTPLPSEVPLEDTACTVPSAAVSLSFQLDRREVRHILRMFDGLYVTAHQVMPYERVNFYAINCTWVLSFFWFFLVDSEWHTTCTNHRHRLATKLAACVIERYARNRNICSILFC